MSVGLLLTNKVQLCLVVRYECRMHRLFSLASWLESLDVELLPFAPPFAHPSTWRTCVDDVCMKGKNDTILRRAIHMYFSLTVTWTHGHVDTTCVVITFENW